MPEAARTLTRDELKPLLDSETGPCVSIFMPLYGPGNQAQQNEVRLRQLTESARQQLKDIGIRDADAGEILDPARQLAKEADIASKDASGLALFAGPELARVFLLPVEMNEEAIVSQRFVVRPLAPLLGGEGRFFVLALSQGGLRLLDCTRRGAVEKPLPEVESSYKEFISAFEFDRSLQWHSPDKGGYHGHSDSGREKNSTRKLREYLRQVETSAHAAVAPTAAPLVLAGLEKIRGLYHEVNHYSGLVEHEIEANVDTMSSEELRREGWRIMEPRFESKTSDVQSLLRKANDSRDDTVLDNLEDIVNAARFRRVDTLFLAPGAEPIWGRIEDNSGSMEFHQERKPGDEDLIDRAVFLALKFGGTVQCVREGDMPPGLNLAALLRSQSPT